MLKRIMLTITFLFVVSVFCEIKNNNNSAYTQNDIRQPDTNGWIKFNGKDCFFGIRPGSYETELIRDGKVCATIITPASDDIQLLAKDLSIKIATASNSERLPIMTDIDATKGRCEGLKDEFKNTNLIILGNINNNEAIIPLYARFLCLADAAYPGAGGYTLRTIRNPWGTFKNVILIGASDYNGLKSGIEAFLKSTSMKIKEKNCTCSFLMNLKPILNDKVKKQINNVIAQAKSFIKKAVQDNNITFDMQQIYEIPMAYLITEDPVLAEALKINAKNYTKNLSPVFKTGDYSLEGYYRMFQIATTTNIIDDDAVRKMDTNAFLSLYEMRKEYWLRTSPGKIGSRHQMSGTLAYLMMSFFLNLNMSPNTDSLIRDFIKKQYNGTLSHYKYITEKTYSGTEDEGGLQTDMTSIFQFAFSFGETKGFKTGIAREGIKKLIAVSDNMGYGVGAGIYEDAYPEGATKIKCANGSPLYLASFYFKDGELKWLYKNLPGMGWGSWFGRAPFGFHEYDTDNYIFSTIPDLKKYNALYVNPRPVYVEKCEVMPGFRKENFFDKVTLRSGFKPEDAYVSFQGYTTGNSYQVAIDPMVLLRYCDEGVLWLATNCQLTDSYWRNSFTVSNGFDGTKGNIIPYLNTCCSIDNVNIFSATLPNINGGTWNRWAVYVAPGKLLLVDNFKANKRGEYYFASTLKSPVPTIIHENNFISDITGKRMTVTSAENYTKSLDHGIRRMDAQEFWYIRQTISRKLGENENFSMANLLTVKDIDLPDKTSLRKITDEIFLIISADELVLVGKGPCENNFIKTDTDFFIISNDKAVFHNGTYFNAEDLNIKLNNKQNVYKIFSKNFLRRINNNFIPQNNLNGKTPLGFSRIEKFSRNFGMEFKTVRGFTVSPVPVSGLDALEDNVVKRWDSGTVLQQGKPLLIDLKREAEICRVEIQTSTGKSNGIPTFREPIKIKYRTGNTEETLREKDFMEIISEFLPDMRELYKMDVWQVNRYILNIPPSKARFIEFEGLPDKISELTFYENKLIPSEIRKVKKVDLAGNGQNDLLVETANREITALDIEGKQLFSIKLPYEIIDFIAQDIDGDNKAEIVVACYDLHLYKFNYKGERIKTAGPLFQHPYTMNILKNGNTKKIALTYYYHVQIFDKNLNEITKPLPLAGMWFENAAVIDINGDTNDDMISSDIYGRTYCIDGLTYKISKLFWSPNGISNHIFKWGKSDNGKTPVVFAGMNTIQKNEILPGTFDVIKSWKLSDGSVYNDALFVNLKTAHETELVVAKSLGYIGVISPDGKIIKEISCDGIIHCLAEIRDKNNNQTEFIIVGTSTGIYAFNRNLEEIAFYPGNTEHISVIENKIIAEIDNTINKLEIKKGF
ncbi:MAG: hypothetical protein UT30_C0022G0006 [Candidatus Uhrbacteria bacterium GW2011_GWF2_39_13]|uniref:FG-GAP repeat protein n=1 Tax=Candidatus Uhrbacteria bacterium GW2011_GWF2_39_13 TaxID=1618995 RepID=A0A0G0MKM1_9BACT|nr:MAG: hypothetical protein UT30_C0022G0006 [Candidatus Uhrbacteria bacterium GW2011_GWF2_39_13]